jgi:hypothetical protein
VTGWHATGDVLNYLKLNFDTCEQAEDYARRHGLAYEVRTDTNDRVATLAKRNKIQVYDHNFLGPEVQYQLKKDGPNEAKKIWDFEQPGYSYWTNDKRSDYGPDKYIKANTPKFE